MSSELVLTEPRWRKQIPDAHRGSLDTRIAWLWHQRFGTVQQVWNSSTDVLDVTAATVILQAIMGRDLDSIVQLFNRLEGGPVGDEKVQEQIQSEMRI